MDANTTQGIPAKALWMDRGGQEEDSSGSSDCQGNCEEPLSVLFLVHAPPAEIIADLAGAVEGDTAKQWRL